MSNVELKDFLEAIEYKITGSEPFLWECYGQNARYLDCDSNPVNKYAVSAVFDTTDQRVYSIEAWDYTSDTYYRWLDPEYKKAHKKECKKRGVNHKLASDDKTFTDLDVAEDILEKINAIVNEREYDKRVSIPVDLDDDTMLKLMKMAHEADMTFNDFVAQILEVKMASLAEELKVKE
jgi:hypothetical protein